MLAVILAGGFGTRLRGVVPDLPKPLAPVQGRPFLEYVIDNLTRRGVRQYIFCLHYQATKIQNHFRDGRHLGVEISYSIEKEPLGTGGAIGLLRNRIDRAFLVANADTYLETDLAEMVSLHREQGALGTIALAEIKNAARYGQVHLDKSKQITGFLEKRPNPAQALINAGLYLFEPGIFSDIKENKFVSLEKEVLPAVLARGAKIIGCPGAAHFFDIGIPEDYRLFIEWAAQH